MDNVYALVVGIDAYHGQIRPLSGCGNDLDLVKRYLTTRVAAQTKLRPLALRDGQATRQAVIDGFRNHLGQAGPGDTALFWFSGHGSLAPVPVELKHTESTGWLQTLLCVDSRQHGVPDLYDKELAVLIGEVATRGAHVAVVLDCCHAESGDRDDTPLTRRFAPPLTQPQPVTALLAELRRTGPADRVVDGAGPDHVALAACQSDQAAQELPIGGSTHGVFTVALLEQLGRLGSAATYREVMVGARCYVENVVRNQVPVLWPAGHPLIDQPFLGGQFTTESAPLTMRYVRGAWEINVGACHGLVPGDANDPTLVAVHGADPVRQARVTRVYDGHSTVTPLDWVPDPTTQYPMVLTSVPLPAVTVTIGAGPTADRPTADRIVSALATASPTGRPSPHVRPLPANASVAAADLRVDTAEAGVAEIRSRDGELVTTTYRAVTTAARAARVVTDLEHIARWRQIRALKQSASTVGRTGAAGADPGPPGRAEPTPGPTGTEAG